MAVSLKHSKTAIGDDNPDRQVSVSHWNAEHTLTGTANTVLGFDTNGLATETTIVGSYAASVATRSALAALSSSQAAVNLRESGREGLFVWDSSNNAANVTADPGQGIYVAPSTDTTGASGAWVRKFVGPKSAKWFGAVGDGTTDDAIALQRWLDSGGDLLLPATPSATWFRSSAKLYVRKNCHVRGEQPLGNDSRSGIPAGYQYILGSRIVFDAGVAGLDVQTSTTLSTAAAVAAAGSGAFTQEGAFNSTFEDFGIIGSGGATANGITVRTIARFRNIRVCQFSGKGWYLVGNTDSSANEYGNVSNTSLLDCSAEANGSHGLNLSGIDANTCKITNFNAQVNSGWGIYQEALIGSVFDKPHLATNTLGAFKTVSAANNTIIQPYIETGTGSNVDILDNNVVIGEIRSLNVAGRLTTSIGVATIQAADIEAVGTSAPLTVNSTNSNGPKIVLKDNGTVRSYLGSDNASGYDFSVRNADGVATFNLYSAANSRRCEIVGGAWWSTAATRLGVTTGAQVFYDTTGGGVFAGGGSSYDVSIQNKSGTTAIRIPTGTTNAEIVGSLTVGGVAAINSSGVIQAAATPAFTGDVTKSAGSLSTTIAANAVTYAKFQQVAANSLVGNPTGSLANAQGITLAGGLAFSGTTLTAAGALTPTSVASTGAVTSSSASAGNGYATGAGGTVTQITSRTTGVTLNKVCGAITLFSAAGSATYNTFTVTNSAVAATDTIVVNQKSGTNLYIILVTAVAAGSFNISFATTGGTATDAPVFNFAVVKAVAA